MSVSFTRLWMLRLIRYGVGIIVVEISLSALLCEHVNRSGARHWAEVKARIESEGETLDFKKLLPPPVDKATNFCAIEALDGIALEGNERSLQGRKRMALEELGWRKKVGIVSDIRGGRDLGQKVDLRPWARLARDTTFIKMPPDSGDAARDLLQAIDESQPLVKVLAEASVTHPRAGFTPLMRDHPPASFFLAGFGISYGNSAQNAQAALGLRALAANECGDSAGATASVQAMMRLADALSREPTPMSLLVSLGAHYLAEDALWSVLEKRNTSEPELRSLQAALESLRFEKRALAAMRGELAMGIDAATFTQQQAKTGMHSFYMKTLYGWYCEPPSGWLTAVLGRLVPPGIFDENKAVIASLEFEGAVKPLKAGGYANVVRHELAMQQELRAHRGILHPDYLVAHVIVPPLANVINRLYAGEAVRRQAIIACALERYYIQHHAYPATLAQLVPSFITAILDDPMDDQPMRYRQTGDGRYMTWSVGFDQKDDDGKVNIDPKEKWPHDGLYKSGYKGDWSWQYQPIK